MNAFYEHHQDSIGMHYACFDRMVLDARIPAFLRAERALGFFSQDRGMFPVHKNDLVKISDDYERWVREKIESSQCPLLDAPEGRRDEFMEPYFASAQPDQIVGIIKAREPVVILTAVGFRGKSTHLELKLRWVNQYNYYMQDRDFGPMFVRVSPYFPFTARLCLNHHDWIANRLRRQGIDFQQRNNSFVACSDPLALQNIADTLTAQDLTACGRKWIHRLVPFFTEEERNVLGCEHRFYFKQMEYCDNLIFRERTVLDALHDRLLDSNRKLGSPDQVAVVFGQRITRQHNGRLQTTLDDLHLGQPILRAFFKHSILKNYVRGGPTEFGGFDRAEVGTNDVTDFRGIKKGVENLPLLRERLSQITNNFRNAQQDILETFLDRGELHRLSQPTVNGKKRIPGLKLDNPRQLALMHALVAFSHVLAGQFTTADLYPRVLHALGCSAEQYKLNSLRYDLSKLRAKELVEKIPHSRRYQMTVAGYRLCLVYLKVFEKLYAPLTAAVIHPCPNDQKLPLQKTTALDQLYLAVKHALDNLVHEIGLDVEAA
jgi:hypothetical protein